MQNELNVRKILGRTYLNENRLAEALDIFVNILMDYPDDLETLLILGGFYLAGGDGKTAKSLYLRAKQLDPQNKTIERQIIMAEELEQEKTNAAVPTDMDSVSRLLQRLSGKTSSIEESDILRAADLLEKIINSQNPADLVSAHLDEIDGLLLALIEVNIRQARADGHRDVAEALYNLQLNIDMQITNQESHGTLLPDFPDQANQPIFAGSLLMLLPDPEKKSERMMLLKDAMEAAGCQILEKSEYVRGRDPRPDLVITSNPHTNPKLIEGLSALSELEVPVVLDLDADFNEQPAFHQDDEKNGLGVQTRSNAFVSAVSLADLVTVPSQAQASALGDDFDPMLVIPDGWSRQNRFWEKAPAPHAMINIGWVGTSGELEDLILIRRFIIRIIREFPNTRIVIVGDPHAYRLFDGLGENRRMYIPLVGHEEFPYLLSQLDILLVPLLNRPNNQTLPDTILMQAGARGIPWLATPIPSFCDWGAGGLLTETSGDEWHLNLRHLVMDKDLRSSLGRAGREASRSREMTFIGRSWLNAISQLTAGNVPTSQTVRKAKNLA
jgi:glycosyltransferase involved in cell wall biosynthesis